MTVIITAIMLAEILPANNMVMDIKGASFMCHTETLLSGLAGVNKLWCVCWWALFGRQHCWDAAEVRATSADGWRETQMFLGSWLDFSSRPLFTFNLFNITLKTWERVYGEALFRADDLSLIRWLCYGLVPSKRLGLSALCWNLKLFCCCNYGYWAKVKSLMHAGLCKSLKLFLYILIGKWEVRNFLNAEIIQYIRQKSLRNDRKSISGLITFILQHGLNS